jgi:hypothetical protein
LIFLIGWQVLSGMVTLPLTGVYIHPSFLTCSRGVLCMNNSIDLDSIVVVSSDQVSGDLQEGNLAILNLKDGVYYGLNPVGSRIWSLLQDPKSVAEIRDTLLAEYNVETDVCTRELIDLLSHLSSRQLIEVNAAAK